MSAHLSRKHAEAMLLPLTEKELSYPNSNSARVIIDLTIPKHVALRFRRSVHRTFLKPYVLVVKSKLPPTAHGFDRGT